MRVGRAGLRPVRSALVALLTAGVVLTPAAGAQAETSNGTAQTESLACDSVDLWVNSGSPGNVVKSYSSTGTAKQSIVLDDDYGDIAWSADGTKLYGTDYDDGDIDTINLATGGWTVRHGLTGAAAGKSTFNSLSALPNGNLLLGVDGESAIYEVNPSTGLTAVYARSLPDGYSPAGDFLTLPDGDLLALVYEETALEDFDSTLMRLKSDGTRVIIGTAPGSYGMMQSGGAVYLAGVDGIIRKLSTVPTASSVTALTTSTIASPGIELWGASTIQDAGYCNILKLTPDSSTVPVGGSITFTASGLAPTATGTIDVTTGVIALCTITLPALACTAPAPATLSLYEVTGTWSGGQTADAVFTVVAATPPVPVNLTSSGAGRTPQAVTVTIPSSGAATLLDAGSSPVSTVTVAGQGVYTLSGTTITFVAAVGYTGTVTTPVTYRLTTSGGLSGTGTYTPTVTLPEGPTGTPKVSTGTGPDPQTATITIPADATASLLSAGGSATDSVTVAGQGTYTRSGTTITFTPVAGYSGVATPVTYRLTDAYGQTGSSTYTPTVTKPEAPTATAKTSTGAGTTPQTATAAPPAGGSVRLLSAGTPASTVTVDPDEGVYTVNAQTGVLTFTAVAGFIGVAQPATFRVIDAYEQHGDATYTPTVTKPPGPTAPDETTTGVGTTPQTTSLPVPAKGSIALLDDNGNPTSSLFIPNKGTYTLTLVSAAALSIEAASVPNPSNQQGSATVTFTPVLGFHGALPPVNYTVTDAYGQTATATYTPNVTIPAPPAPPAQTTTGTPTDTQTATLPVPSGGSITLLDAAGHPAIVVTIPKQGTYVLEPASGHISFVPVQGFSGQAKAVRYRVTDAYAQVAESTYAAFVTASALAATGLNLIALISAGLAGIPLGTGFILAGGVRRRRLV